jgi:hypothetical protein
VLGLFSLIIYVYKDFTMIRRSIRLISTLVLALAVLQTGCGVGELGSIYTGTPINVSLPANGGSAVASGTTPGAAASYLIDGNTSNTNYWAGVVTNDYVTVSFNRSYMVSKFVLYLNATSTSDIKIQTSTDGTGFSDVALSESTCSSLSVGSGRIDCTFGTKRPLRAVRIVVINTAAPSTVQLNEMEVSGY